MNDLREQTIKLPPEQQAIRDKCFHPSGMFVEFPHKDVETSIPERFEKIVRLYPDRIALKIGTDQITYADLNGSANRLAHALVAKLGPGQEPVALFFERGISLVIANIAVLKAGKIALDVNPSAEMDRIRNVLKNAEASVVLTDRRSESRIYDRGIVSTATINIEELASHWAEENLHLCLNAESYAEISFTSGSTGRAKSVVKTHRQRLSEVMNFTNLCHVGCADRLSNFGLNSLGKQLFYALLNGAAQYPILLQSDELFHLGKWLMDEGITIFISLPTAFRHLATMLPEGKKYPNLRVIRLGGESLSKKDVELYKRHFSSGCVLVNMYASKETGTVSQYLMNKSTTVNGRRVPVGYPRSGIKIYLLDDLGKEVSRDQTGEIVVQSRELNSGSWQGRDKTAKPAPLKSLEAGESLYFTGDLGRLSADGCLEHLGRKDAMAKIRGFRVDTGEVEAALSGHPGVADAVVMVRENSFGDKKLIGYFVPRNGSAPTVNDLRNFLQETLPDYMIPSSFVALPRWPLLANRKVNRRALPDPDKSRPRLDIEYVPPRTGIEERLERIWAEVLVLDRIGIYDNFFDLGGHSLAATRVVSRVIQQFQLAVLVKALFDSPTIADMAQVIEQNRAKRANREDLERMLSEIEAMSEEKAERLLSEVPGQ